MAISLIAAILIFSFAPELLEKISSIVELSFDFENLPEPYTASFFSYIFLNNSGHFWNPIRMLVWIPFLGTLLVAFEILINCGLIGIVAVITGVNNGIEYPLLGLVPHGIIEIPAFILQLSSVILWQVTITEAIVAKLKGKTYDTIKMKLGIRDVLILAVTSIVLLFIAAIIETYITPYLLGF
jgi:stage II sporulation protein M